MIKHRVSIGHSVVCDRWASSFDDFLIDMGRKPSAEHTADRILSSGIYEPSNCRWASIKEQARNRSDNRRIIVKGESKCISELAEEYSVNKTTLYTRLFVLGWPPERALIPPAVARHRPSGDTLRQRHKYTYCSWTSMRSRCLSSTDKYYSYYGGRGIVICATWGSFDVFLDDMGPRPAEMTLDRIDSNGPYCVDNCRWATKSEQARNKRNTIFIVVDGISIPAVEFARRLGVRRHVVHDRILRGMNAIDIAIELAPNALSTDTETS